MAIEEAVIHEGDPDCDHVWVNSETVVQTDPAVRKKICMHCGRVETEHIGTVDIGLFDRLYETFYGAEE